MAEANDTTSVNTMSLAELDPDVAAAMNGELSRQRDTLEMIASENFVPRAVLQAQGSVLTNKYAEGYPGRRYYGGCEYVDVVEDIARDRAKELFGAEFANVQPHSGAQANAAVLMALMEPGQSLLGLDLAHGGHLTHGMRLNFSGKYFNVVDYLTRVQELSRAVRFDSLQMAAASGEDIPAGGVSVKLSGRMFSSGGGAPASGAAAAAGGGRPSGTNAA